MIEAILLLSLSVAAPAAPPQDPADSLARVAREAARRYEYLQRKLIPYRRDAGWGGDCDEIIGRFCFHFDREGAPPEPPPPPEDTLIAEARLVAVRAHREWFSVAPAEPMAAGTVVRYLIEDGRAREAVAAARTHAWAAERSPGSLMVVGLALHYAGDFAEAEAVFDSARMAMEPEARRRLDDVEVLLEPAEAGRYRDLDPAAREAYERRFWAFADPSLLQPGNERRSGHYARHAWARILSEAPRVAGMLSWGSDHDEIIVRYGRPTARSRIRQDLTARLLDPGVRLVESFDPLAVSFVEPALISSGIPDAPELEPDRRLERKRTRSSYAGILLPRMRAMAARESRFPAPDGVLLRVDGTLPPDTVEPEAPLAPRGLLVALDTLGREVGRVAATTRVESDGVTRFAAELVLPPGEYVYRAEVADDSSGIAGLAQHRVRLAPPLGLTLSDLVIAFPFGDSLPASRDDPALRPRPHGVVPPGEPVGVYAEATGLEPRGGARQYEVEWWLEPAEEGSLIGRAFRWFGRTLGLVQREPPLRVRWEDAAARPHASVAFNLDLRETAPGVYRLGLRLTDRVSGESRTRSRLIRVAPGPVDGYGRVPD